MDIFLVVWLVCGLLGALLGQSKNRKIEGLLLGFFLGILGLIILVFLPPREEGTSFNCLGFAVAIIVIVSIGGVAAYFLIERSVRMQKQTEEIAQGDAAETGKRAAQAKKPGWELTWEQINKQDIGPRMYYEGVIQHRFSGGNFIVRCATRTRVDSGPVGDFVLVELPDAQSLVVNQTIAFYARAAGKTSFETSDKSRRELVRLVYEPPDASTGPRMQDYRNPLSKKPFRN